MRKLKKKVRKILGLNHSRQAWTKYKLAADIKKYQYDIGDHTYGKPTVLFWSAQSNLQIGKYCSIGENVKIYLGGGHNVSRVTTYPFGAFRKAWGLNKSFKEVAVSKGGVEIGSDVWIADNVVILSGVKIGHGAVIANSAVVTKDVAPYTIVGGNPAKPIKKRFDDNIIEKLLNTKWWDMENDKIAKLIPLLLSEDIDAFIKGYKK